MSNGYSVGEMKPGSMLKLSIGKILGHENFQPWPICADKYKLLAFSEIIAIITINCDYRQNCKVFTSIITIYL